MGKQSQLLLKPTEVELGLQVGVEFDNNFGYLTWLFQEEDWPGTFHICCSKVSFSSLPISLIGSEEFKRLEEVAKLARTSS